MFEFGRDLRKLFAQARESDDLSWLELIGVDLLESEARRQGVDSNRVSCARPLHEALRAAALWREHARRSGRVSSLDRAIRAVDDAARQATDDQGAALAAVESARILLLRFDLCGGPGRLDQAAARLAGVKVSRRSAAASAAAAVHASLKARQARLSGDAAAMMDAAALLDSALHERDLGGAGDELRMDRALLALEAGLKRRDPRLLDLAGRDLRRLVETASPDYRPLTRARALALCGVGMRCLADLAGDEAAAQRGQTMFEAAADQFTPDHSPLDWAAVQVAAAGPDTPLEALLQAEALCEGGGLVLGALAREARAAREIELAEAAGDMAALDRTVARLRKRLAMRDAARAPLDWAADQIALAHAAMVHERLTGRPARAVGLILAEAAAAALDHGAPALAARAERLG